MKDDDDNFAKINCKPAGLYILSVKSVLSVLWVSVRVRVRVYYSTVLD